MSYFSVTDFIDSGEKSLYDKNYWSALSISLALPSMCSRIMYQNDEYKGINRNDSNGYWYEINNGKICWHDKKCYVDFCNEVIRDMWLIYCLGIKFADILYQLRCDIIHAGVSNIYEDNKGIYLMLGEMPTSTEFAKYRTISIKGLCNAIFSHVNTWCSNNSANNFKYTYVFDTENSYDDRILYNRLCDEDRAEYLKEQFEKKTIGKR